MKSKKRKQGLIFLFTLPLVWGTRDLKMRFGFGIGSRMWATSVPGVFNTFSNVLNSSSILAATRNSTPTSLPLPPPNVTIKR